MTFRSMLSRLRIIVSLMILFGLVRVLRFIKFPAMGDRRLTPDPAGAIFGIALSPTHGTIATRDRDGSYHMLGKLDGNSAYLSMMKRLDKTHPDPINPHGELWDYIRDSLRQALRTARKYLGLPATADVGTSAVMVRKLLDLGQQHVSSISVGGVVISTPGASGFTTEDVDDILEYNHTPALRTSPAFSSAWPDALDSAFVANSYGLCESFLDREACRAEVQAMRCYSLLLVDFSRNVTTIQLKDFIRTPLGRCYSRADFDKTSLDVYHHLRQSIASFVLETFKDRQPEVDKIFVTGDCADNDDVLKDTIIQCLQDVGAKEDKTLYASDPLYMTAKGAATFAWREAAKLRYAAEVTDRLSDASGGSEIDEEPNGFAEALR